MKKKIISLLNYLPSLEKDSTKEKQIHYLFYVKQYVE
ncbi:hypothetical protein Gotur_015578 [Gossypium turneri]